MDSPGGASNSLKVQSMKLNELLGRDFPEIAVQLEEGRGDIDISGITADSRKVEPGSLFVALSGSKADGASFIADAISKGAAAVVSAHAVAGSSAPVLETSTPRRALALAAARFYGR